jgi:hypothetical protein
VLGVTAQPNLPLQRVPSEARAEPPFADNRDPAPSVEHPMQAESRRVDIWLRRVAVLLFVVACASIGVVLIILPWRAEWTDNYLLTRYSWLRPTVGSGFFRGICSGLGLLDVWLGFREAVHYQEEKG